VGTTPASTKIVQNCFVTPAGGAVGSLAFGGACKRTVDAAFKMVHGNAYDDAGWCDPTRQNADAPCSTGKKVYLSQSLINMLVDIYKQAKPSKIAYAGYPYLSPDNNYALPTYKDGAYYPLTSVRSLQDDAESMQIKAVAAANEKLAQMYGGVRPIVFVSVNHPTNTIHSFNGHEPYPSYIGRNSARWVHEFLDTSDLELRESYHPNPIGHQAYATLMSDANLF